jgi:hypothetical protein
MADASREPDDLDRYLAEQLRDPGFAAAYRRAAAREPWYLPSTRETVTWGDALRRARARRRRREATASTPHLSSMRSSYRSRMKARHRRG